MEWDRLGSQLSERAKARRERKGRTRVWVWVGNWKRNTGTWEHGLMGKGAGKSKSKKMVKVVNSTQSLSSSLTNLPRLYGRPFRNKLINPLSG